MTYDIRIWDQPADLPIPTKMDEIEPLVDELWERRPGPNAKVIAFAERITAAYPSQVQAYRQEPRDEDFAWIGDPLENARKEESGVFAFSLNLTSKRHTARPSREMLMTCIVEAAIALGLIVLDEQTGVLWLPSGRVIGPDEEYEEAWARTSMKMYSEQQVPRSERSMNKLVGTILGELLAPYGFKRQKSVSGWPRWEAATKVGLVSIELFLNGAGRYGYSWNLWIDIVNPEVDAVARLLLDEYWLKKPTCHFELGELDGVTDWGMICSPETIRIVPKVVSQDLLPLFDRWTSLAAFDEFLNEATASTGRETHRDIPILPHLDRQSIEMFGNFKPIIVAWLTASRRFDALVDAKRRRYSETEHFDALVSRLRAEVAQAV